MELVQEQDWCDIRAYLDELQNLASLEPQTCYQHRRHRPSLLLAQQYLMQLDPEACATPSLATSENLLIPPELGR